MKNSWTTATVGDVCEVGDGAHAKVKRVTSGVPYLTSRNIGEGRLKLRDVDYISSEDYEWLFSIKSSSTRRPQPGDVLIGIIGTFGNAYLYRKADSFGVSSSVAILRPRKDLLDPGFLFYVVRSEHFREVHSAYKSGSVQGYTNIPTIKALPISVPCLSQQRAIAHVLGTLDDKIELNRRMNETLEAMAQAIYKSWFLDAIQYDLPDGWRELRLSECCKNIFSGGTPSTQSPQYWNGDIPWLSSGETRSKFIVSTEKSITPVAIADSSTRLARASATVIASAGQGHTRGQTSYLTFDSYINQSVVALVANQSVVSDIFLFLDLERRYEEFRQLSDSHSSRGSLTTKLLSDLKVALPPRNLISNFDRAVRPIIDKVIANLRESNTVASLRDALAPKLLSGQLSVTNVQAA